MLIKFASALLLVLELIEHSLRMPSSNAREFYEHVFSKISNDKLPGWSRPYASVFAVSSALSRRAYDAALAMLHAPSIQFPWKETSTRLLKRVFEVALIFGDESIARRSLMEVASRSSLSVEYRSRMNTLMRWRFEGLLTSEAAALNMTSTYFDNFPEYDEYFKGAASELQGKILEAKVHFERSMALAPLDARELREALETRLLVLSQGRSREIGSLSKENRI